MGFTFTGFTNGNYLVTAATTTSVTIASTATAGASTSGGTVSFYPNGVEDMFGPYTLYNTSAYGNSLAATSRWAATFGVQFVAYEGFMSFNVPTIGAEYSLLNDSRAIPKFLAFQNTWDQAGGDLCCAFTLQGANSAWSMVGDQTNPYNTTKYAAWIATTQIARQNATIWPSRGYIIPGNAWASRLDSAFSSSAWLTTPQPTGPGVFSNGAFPTYIWYSQDKFHPLVTFNITATVAGTADFYYNGVLQSSAQAITVGTNNYTPFLFGLRGYSEGPLISAAVHFKTGSGATVNTVTMS